MSILKSVLVVDDSGINRLLPGLILRPFGWTVFEAESGADALQILETYQVSCILLDIVMPDRDGFQVLNDIRKFNMYSNIKIFAYTGNFVSRENILNLKKSGFDEVILKPITSKKLIEMLTN